MRLEAGKTIRYLAFKAGNKRERDMRANWAVGSFTTAAFRSWYLARPRRQSCPIIGPSTNSIIGRTRSWLHD